MGAITTLKGLGSYIFDHTCVVVYMHACMLGSKEVSHQTLVREKLTGYMGPAASTIPDGPLVHSGVTYL